MNTRKLQDVLRENANLKAENDRLHNRIAKVVVMEVLKKESAA
jgi:regulator of replication initiation timing